MTSASASKKVSEVLEHYMPQSEQLDTWLVLAPMVRWQQAC